MKLTTKGRYAVMAVVELACSKSDAPIRLAELAEKQQISLSYMEQMFALLKKNGVVRSVRGPGGGYLLAAPAASITIASIVQAVEEGGQSKPFAPALPEKGRPGIGPSKTHALWSLLSTEVNRVLSSITLADVCEGRVPGTLPPAIPTEAETLPKAC